MSHNTFWLLLMAVGAYLVGAAPFGLLVGRLRGVDVRLKGSGNIGATNVARVLGLRWGLLVFGLDVAKGAAPTATAAWIVSAHGAALGLTSALTQTLAVMLIQACCVFGHIWPVYLRFKGGKGVATSLGILLGYWPYLTLPGLVALATWGLVLWAWRYVSAASIVSAMLFPFYVLGFGLWWGWPVATTVLLAAFSVVMGALVVIRHRGNIRRLLAGTEPKIGQGGTERPGRGLGVAGSGRQATGNEPGLGQQEIDASLKIQAELASKGEFLPLADVLVRQGYITRDQIDRIAKHGVPDDSMTPSARHIPGYHIIAKVGQGSMATVWKARQLSVDRLVAIKILPKRLSEDAEFVERFYRDGNAAATLDSPNIVQVIEVGEAQGYLYFVMEYVEGRTVYDDLSKGRAYAEQDALDITIQVTEALACAHGKGLIHRDVKPRNVMITSQGVAKLADMGLARAKNARQATVQDGGRAYGTPYYTSPEQIRGQPDIDFRTDVYSLGATLYHMVTGKAPFDGPSPLAVMQKHLDENILFPGHVRAGLSARVIKIIETMMAKDPRKRYASTEELLRELRAAQG
jgi:acyl-phosphate glycerol 3-phosphate acyltransferase